MREALNEAGFASPLMLALLALAALLCLATTDAANVLLARARAQSAADAAALAAAAAQWRDDLPDEAARTIAESNGASLESCDCPRHGDRALVVVSRPTRIRMLGVAPRSVSASAEARMDVGRLFAPPG